MATNRIESLDPALIRPGRIDRKIEFPLPDTKTKRRIFNIHTSKMTLAPDVNLEEFIMAKAGLPSSQSADSPALTQPVCRPVMGTPVGRQGLDAACRPWALRQPGWAWLP